MALKAQSNIYSRWSYNTRLWPAMQLPNHRGSGMAAIPKNMLKSQSTDAATSSIFIEINYGVFSITK